MMLPQGDDPNLPLERLPPMDMSNMEASSPIALHTASILEPKPE